VQAQALRFARCMRSHGVPDFPDPSFTGGAIGIGIPQSVRNSPAYTPATHACKALTIGVGGYS
jgi:hypothetical protein